MRLHLTKHRDLRRTSAMTLVELMVCCSVFVMLLGGMIALQIFGMRYDQIATSKLGASDQARRSFNAILTDIRSAKGVVFGTNNGTTFTNIGLDTLYVTPALQLTYARSTNVVVYYFDKTNCYLCRRTNGIPGFEVMASDLTNTFMFRGETYSGVQDTLSDNDDKVVVSIIMEFYKYQYPLVTIGSNQLYDYYKLEFKATKRNYD